MSWIGDYFGWAVGLAHFGGGTSIGSLVLMAAFVVAVPAVALLVGATVLVWLLAALKLIGAAARRGFHDGWSRAD